MGAGSVGSYGGKFIPHFSSSLLLVFPCSSGVHAYKILSGSKAIVIIISAKMKWYIKPIIIKLKIFCI